MHTHDRDLCKLVCIQQSTDKQNPTFKVMEVSWAAEDKSLKSHIWWACTGYQVWMLHPPPPLLQSIIKLSWKRAMARLINQVSMHGVLRSQPAVTLHLINLCTKKIIVCTPHTSLSELKNVSSKYYCSIKNIYLFRTDWCNNHSKMLWHSARAQNYALSIEPEQVSLTV